LGRLYGGKAQGGSPQFGFFGPLLFILLLILALRVGEILVVVLEG
jgi:hypothetical protein